MVSPSVAVAESVWSRWVSTCQISVKNSSASSLIPSSLPSCEPAMIPAMPAR